MRRAILALVLIGMAATAVAVVPTSIRAANGTSTLVVGDHGRDGERAAGLVSNDGPSWGMRSDEFCGEVGNPPGESFRLGTELVFPLRDLPDGARVTRATLAIHDSNPAAAPTIKVIGFIGEEMLLGVEPLHPTGSVTIAPAAGDGREAFDVSGLVTDDTVALGWTGFWLEPGDDAEGVHDVSCPRDTLFPILTLEYTVEPVPPLVPGTLVIGGGDGESGFGLRTMPDGGWGGLTSWLCGDVGRQLDEDVEGRVVLQFPLRDLPAGASVTRATLALHDGNPGAGGDIAVVGFVTDGLILDGLDRNAEPQHATGTLTIRPASAEARESWDLAGLVSEDMISAGWAAFLFRAADDSDGMHHISCPGEPFYPILSLEYVAPTAPGSPAPNPTPPPTAASPGRDATTGSGPLTLLAGVLGGCLWLLVVARRGGVRARSR